jgi:cohesin complex subunit SA-1/2
MQLLTMLRVQQGITEYPLVAKAKFAASFRRSFTEFFNCLTRSLARTNIIFDDEAVMEVITSWISSMSSAGNRPFRHTATVAALAIVTALCEIARGIVDNAAKIQRQAEGERKKGRVNKARVAELQKQVHTASRQQETLEGLMQNWFDTVFVHRYRDIDPKVRVDCAAALGDWATIYPDLFFEGQYLRYLGWVLSDEKAPTRHEVVKVLIKLYNDQDKLSGLRTFSERFRPRMVEMATMDHDPGVRAATVELLEVLRGAGFLEPDDVDSVGRMIFDSEPRVRKAVVAFFIASVDDFYEAKVEELGGRETLDEVLAGGEDNDDFEAPRVEWLKLKSLAVLLQMYDAQGEMEAQDHQDASTNDAYILVAHGLGSRFSQAAEMLCDKIPELKEWEALSGYLLYDHSTQNATATETDTETLFKQAAKLDEREEIVLLEVLHSAVKLSLTRAVEATADVKHAAAAKKKAPTKKQRQEAEEAKETVTRHLAQLIPRLLNKFGAIPATAYAVLRLEHVLNLEIFQELRQDLTAYSNLLDDIKKQFMSHSQSLVVEEASRALLHAKKFPDLEEITEEKVQGLWDDTVAIFEALVQKSADLSVRGNLSDNMLTALSNTVLRIRKLAEIVDPTPYFDKSPPVRKKVPPRSCPIIDSILQIIERGIPKDSDSELDAEVLALEDAMAVNAAYIALQYFIWKVRSFRELIESTGTVSMRLLEPIAGLRDSFDGNLIEMLKHRHGADDVRVTMAGVLVDMYVLFQTLNSVKPAPRRGQPTGDDEDPFEQPNAYLALALEIPAATQELLLQILVAAEKAFAKRSKKSIEEEVMDEPVDTDEEPASDGESDGEDVETDEAAKEQKLKATILAEQRLCSYAARLVLGLLAGVLDGKTQGRKSKNDEGAPVSMVEHRMRRNYKHLGPNFKAVIDWLDENRPGAKRKAKVKGKPKEPSKALREQQSKKSAPLVIEDDDIEDEDGEQEEQQEQNDEEMIDAEEGQRQEQEAEANAEAVAEAAGEGESVLGD